MIFAEHKLFKNFEAIIKFRIWRSESQMFIKSKHIIFTLKFYQDIITSLNKEFK